MTIMKNIIGMLYPTGGRGLGGWVVSSIGSFPERIKKENVCRICKLEILPTEYCRKITFKNLKTDEIRHSYIHSSCINYLEDNIKDLEKSVIIYAKAKKWDDLNRLIDERLEAEE